MSGNIHLKTGNIQNFIFLFNIHTLRVFFQKFQDDDIYQILLVPWNQTIFRPNKFLICKKIFQLQYIQELQPTFEQIFRLLQIFYFKSKDLIWFWAKLELDKTKEDRCW